MSTDKTHQREYSGLHHAHRTDTVCNNSSWWSINPIQSDPGGQETLPPTKMSVDILKTSTDTATIAECLKQHPDVAMSKDSNGNIEIVSGRKIFYDYENRPIRIITSEGSESTYKYDYEGNRVIKTVDGVRTTYIGTIYEETADETIEYIHAGNQRVAMKSSKDGVFYFHPDHLGSTNKISNVQGFEERRTWYTPFGSVFSTGGGKDNDHKFTGQRSDDPTGLYYYGARYYDPELGIFLTPDTIVQSPYDPQTLNRYSYCRNNPIIYTDPSGHIFGIDDLLFIAICATAGGVYGGTHGFSRDLNNFDWQAAGQGALAGAAIGATLVGANALLGIDQWANAELSLYLENSAGIQGEILSLSSSAGVKIAGYSLGGGMSGYGAGDMIFHALEGGKSSRQEQNQGVNNPLTIHQADQYMSSYLLFDRSDSMISMYGLTGIEDGLHTYGGWEGSWPATNIAQSSSKGEWPNGTYKFDRYNPGKTSLIKPQGNLMFNVTGRSSMGVHAGRGSDYRHPTNGCIRVSEYSMSRILNFHQQYPIGFIIVQS